MQIVNSELTVFWLSGAQISYVDSVIAEESDGGFMQPINRQTRPLLQMTFETLEAAEIMAMFGTTRSGRLGFFIRPPLERFYKVTAATLGIATGSSQAFQLQISLGTLTWDALYPVESTILIYKNAVLISDSLWALGDDGVVTLDAGAASNGQTITATFEYKTAVRFVDPELGATIETPDYETIQSCTLREVF